MIRRLKYNTITTLLLGSFTLLQASCPINITNSEINPKPLDYKGLGHITFNIEEDKGTTIIAKDSFGNPTCELNVEMSYISLKNKDLTNVTGEALQYFDITFNETQNRVYFKQKADIPANIQKNIDIEIDITKQSLPSEKFNGFQLNVYASNVEASEFTYTKPVIIPVPTLDTIDGDTNNTIITANTAPEINGTCEDNHTVILGIDGVNIEPTALCKNGTYSIIPTTPLSEGDHYINAKQTDPKTDQTSYTTPAKNLTIDTIATAPTVIITEDTNNDGNLSIANEVNGDIDVLITLPSDVKVGDILSIIHPDGNETNVTVTQSIIDNGYPLTYTVPKENTIITIKAKLTDRAGNISEESSDTTTLINDNIPDYDVDISLNKTTVENVDTAIEILVTISELNNGINSNDLIFTLTKNMNFKIDFDNTLTTLGGRELKNNEWEFLEETATSYNFKYIGNTGKYPSKTRMRMGFKGLFSPPATIRGKFIMNARIKSGSGDINTKNNKDSDAVIYSNIQ